MTMASGKKTQTGMLWGSFLNWLSPVSSPTAYVNHLAQTYLPAKTMDDLMLEVSKSAQCLRHLEAHSGLSGEHRTVFRGQGLDFSELREYNPGDDIRKLDWQVFARTQVPHIREYKEERQIKIWLALEWSLALSLGKASCILSELSGAESSTATLLSAKSRQAMALALALSALAQDVGAKIGVYTVSAQGHRILPPACGQAQHRRLANFISQACLGQALICQCAPEAYNPQDPFTPLRRLVQKQDWVLVLTDASRINQDWVRPLGELSRNAHISIFALYDAEEFQLPEALSSFRLQSPSTFEVSHCGEGAWETAATSESDVENTIRKGFSTFSSTIKIIPTQAHAPLGDTISRWSTELAKHASNKNASKHSLAAVDGRAP